MKTFLQWFVQEEHGLKNLDHYLDDFFFAEMSDIECSNSMFKFKTIGKRLGVPIADEKTEVPVTSIEYLGLTIDTESMSDLNMLFEHSLSDISAKKKSSK
jgi:hypothetical protein